MKNIILPPECHVLPQRTAPKSRSFRKWSKAWLGLSLLLFSCGRTSPAPASGEGHHAATALAAGRPDFDFSTQQAKISSDPAMSCPAIDWVPNLDHALQRALQENKPVLIAFSARQQELGCGNEF